MPLYEYGCNRCKARFELLLPRRSTAAAVKCTECGSSKTRRLMSACVAHGRSADGSTSAAAGAGTACSGCSRSSCAGCRSA